MAKSRLVLLFLLTVISLFIISSCSEPLIPPNQNNPTQFIAKMNIKIVFPNAYISSSLSYKNEIESFKLSSFKDELPISKITVIVLDSENKEIFKKDIISEEQIKFELSAEAYKKYKFVVNIYCNNSAYYTEETLIMKGQTERYLSSGENSITVYADFENGILDQTYELSSDVAKEYVIKSATVKLQHTSKETTSNLSKSPNSTSVNFETQLYPGVWRIEYEGKLAKSDGSEATVSKISYVAIYPAYKSVVKETVKPEGQSRWKYLTKGAIYSTPAVSRDGKTIYVLGHNNETGKARLYAFDVAGINPKWFFDLDARAYYGPSISMDNEIYVGTETGTVYCIVDQGNSATARWTYKAESAVKTMCAIGLDGTAYFGTSNGKFYAIGKDGNLFWYYSTGSAIYSSPIIGNDGTIYFGNSNGMFYAFKPDGTLKWTYNCGSGIYAAASLDNDGTIYVPTYYRVLYALTPTGQLKWSYSASYTDLRNVVVDRYGGIYIISGYYSSYIEYITAEEITTEDGKKWQVTRKWYKGIYNIYDDLRYSQQMFLGKDERVYFADRYYLRAFDRFGNEKWSFKPEDEIYSSPVITSDGTIYFGDKKGNFYAIHSMSGGIDESAPWAKGQFDLQNTGNVQFKNMGGTSSPTVYVPVPFISPVSNLKAKYTISSGKLEVTLDYDQPAYLDRARLDFYLKYKDASSLQFLGKLDINDSGKKTYTVTFNNIEYGQNIDWLGVDAVINDKSSGLTRTNVEVN